MNCAMMKVNTIGISWKMRCWVGSGGGGFIAWLSHMVKP